MGRRYAPDPQSDASLRHSLWDAAGFSVMLGAGESYFSAFALFLGASAVQLGLLASLPALVASLSQLLSAFLGRRIGRRRPVIVAGVAAQLLSWIPLVALPLAVPACGPALLIGWALLYFAAGNVVLPQWSSLMGDLVPEAGRGRFFALRTRIASITQLTALAGAGVLLQLFQASRQAWLGFIAIFALAVSARLLSLWHLTRMHDPVGKVAVLEGPDQALWYGVRGTPFLRFALFMACMQFAVAVGGPFFALYMLRDLGFSYLEYMVNTATAALVTFLTLGLWGRISDTHGNRRVIAVTGFLMPLVPLVWLLSDNFWFLLIAQAYSGFVWSGFNLAANNFLYDLVPAPRRVTLLALYNTLTNLGLFCGALAGAWLATRLPAQFHVAGGTFEWSSVLLEVFFVSGIGRLLAAALFLPRIREVRPIRPLPAVWAWLRPPSEAAGEHDAPLPENSPAAVRTAEEIGG